jgi:ADP-ribosylglycohydrolase
MRSKRELFEGCLVAGAVGDALGYAVEFMRLPEIVSKYGEKGISEPELDFETDTAIISDDTQMTLFTADGMLWAYPACREDGTDSYAQNGMYPSYLRWYYTQTGNLQDESLLSRQPHENGNGLVPGGKNILECKELYKRRAPGNTCVSALASRKMGSIENPLNNSKGCGGVMRVAPVGLFLHNDPERASRVGAEAAALTHGHPTGYLAAGMFSAVIAEIINGKSLAVSIQNAAAILKGYASNQETLRAAERAVELAGSSKQAREAIRLLGEGWVADEALAISLYCALKESNVQEALTIAVNHDGDSDSTGAICGNILGALYGIGALPKAWVQNLELKEFILELSDWLFSLSERAFGDGQ